MGYAADNTRQRFTGYEKDQESDLEFAQARYYNHNHGRFTSVDPTMASADIINPQTFNRYVYVGNNPINITDPTGEIWGEKGGFLYWFKGDTLPDGYNSYSALVGTALGGGLVVLNANGTTTAVANGGEALRLIIGSGAAAAALEASAIALGVTAVAAAGLASAYLCSQDPSSCARSATYSVGMPGTMSLQDMVSMQRYLYGKDSVPSPLDYFDAQGNIKSQYLMNENKSSEEAAEQSTDTEANKPTSGKTEHGEQRSQEARQGDPNRNVGDPNRIKREGRRYRDTQTGNTIYVRGNRVTVYKPNGDFHSSFHNPKRNTRNRVNSGRWEPF